MTRSRRFFASSPWIATGTPDYVNLGYTSRGLAKQALMRLSRKSLAIFRKLGLDKEARERTNLFASIRTPEHLYLFAHESAKLPSEMNKLQKWWKPALVIVVLIIVLQAGVSLLARTHRVHAYLVTHLERAFGRPVEVASFDVRILPSPQLDAHRVSVGEDPAFGQ